MQATDIDIDFADRKQILELIPHSVAMIEDKGRKRKHNTGVYFHRMPEDPVTGLSTVDHKQAEQMGFFKLDMLNVSMYAGVNDEAHLLRLMNQEPHWDLLCHREFAEQLFHVGNHSELLAQLKPKSISDLAAVLAIIRPSKRYLAKSSWLDIRKEVWIKPNNDEYFFKKSHAIAYATAVVVQMNLICEQLTTS